jgi:putative ABC transport system ATP-binding protein
MRPTSAFPAGPILLLRGLAVTAAGKPLLAGIDLELFAGERVALRGPSGCGKTSLLRTITGLVDPAGGRVQLQGFTPSEVRWPNFRRQALLVEQRPVLLAGTVRENLARPFRFRISTSAFLPGKAETILSQLGLKPEILAQEARSLSLGEQQRVCLTRALLLEPKVLLLDEPTSALDEEATLAVESVICTETEQRGLAALIISHNREQAERWCHRVYDLRTHMQER